MYKSNTPSGVRMLQTLGVGATVAALLAVAPARADEVSELKAAVQALQKRIETLESQAKANEDTNDKQTDQIAMVRSNVPSWVPNFTWKGDLRYRNENIDQQYAVERNRDRIRVRAGFVAKVNDTIKTELQVASAEGNDPRSSNQTLTGENTRKPLYIDLAYAEWQALPDWKLTAGKMKYPWVRPGQSVLFDGDVNPEGLAVNFAHGDFFASTFYNILEERGAAGESTMFGGQVGWKPALGAGRLTLAASFFDLNSVQHRNPFFNAASNGNSTTTVGCFAGQSPCLSNDYNLIEGLAEYSVPVAGRPLVLYVDYIKNDAAINSLDTAYSAGFLYGRASDPRTWEIGYFYQKVEKDSLYAQYTDSDYGAGNTDAKGGVLKFGYAFAKNFTLNGTYFLNKTNMDAPVTVAGVGSVFDRDYKRLQVDFNFKY
jgi:hypothetical protein